MRRHASARCGVVRRPRRSINVEDRLPGGCVALRTNSIATVLEAVRLGFGAGDLPCFVGDATPGLVRALPGEKPDWLDVWLIVHADVQRTSRVRIVVDELARVFREGAGLLGADAAAQGDDQVRTRIQNISSRKSR